MNLKTSLILSFVFLGLGMLVFYDAIKWQPERIEQANKEKLIFPFVGKRVTWIELNVPSQGQKRMAPTVNLRIRCMQKNGCSSGSDQRWAIESVPGLGGDATYIGALIGSIINVKRMEKRVKFSEELRLKQNYRLDKQNGRRITVKFTDMPEPVLIVFGGSTPIDSNYYMWTSIAPEFVEVIPHYFYRAADRDAFHWQTKALLPELTTGAATGSATGLTNKRRLRWRADNIGHWYECEPKKSFEGEGFSWRCRDRDWVSADNTMLDGLFRFVRNLRASSRAKHSPQLERQLKRKPQLELEISGEGQEFSLRFYQSAERGFWLVRSSELTWIGKVSMKDLERFQKPIQEYRRRAVISRSERDGVHKIDITRAKKLVKSITNAKEIAEILTPLSRPVVESFHRMSSPSGKAWRKKAQWQVRLYDEKSNLMRELKIWMDGEARAVLDGEEDLEVRELGKKWTKSFLSLITAA